MNAEMKLKIEELLNIATSDSEKMEIGKMMCNINVYNRNADKTEKFTEKIIKKENEKKDVFVKFLESKSINGVIYAPTQVGKSAATRVFIETCFRYNTPVIVSTDNKTDQQEQLYYRIEKDLMGANVQLLKVSDKSFSVDLKKCIETKNKRFVIFCLDNSSQIEKVIIQLTSLYMRCTEMKEIKRLAIIHDEADTVAKDRDTENQTENQAESHKKWLELKDLINKQMGGIDLKRVFVTATPENCVLLYKVECPDVMRLEIPSSYTGYLDIKHVAMEDDLNISKYLKEEVNRIKEDETYEAILYCIDRKIVDGHDRVLKSLATELKCIVNTYNGNGITTYMRTVTLGKKFESRLKKSEIEFTKKDKYYQIKNISIRKFYSIVKAIGENCVITIGKDLICRGISYVGEDQDEPITATTMFYRPGSTMHNVGITQTIGRITGCAMSNLPRKLYSSQDVYDNYITYNKNQVKYMNEIVKSSENTITKDIIDDLIFERYSRNVDRMKLNLRMNMESESESENGSESENRIQELIDMWWGKKSIIGKILKFIYDNKKGVKEEDLKEYFKTLKCSETWYTDLHQPNKDYKIVFQRNKHRITTLNKEARKYIDSM